MGTAACYKQQLLREDPGISRTPAHGRLGDGRCHRGAREDELQQQFRDWWSSLDPDRMLRYLHERDELLLLRTKNTVTPATRRAARPRSCSSAFMPVRSRNAESPPLWSGKLYRSLVQFVRQHRRPLERPAGRRLKRLTNRAFPAVRRDASRGAKLAHGG
jgi:hypothetical protein